MRGLSGRVARRPSTPEAQGPGPTCSHAPRAHPSGRAHCARPASPQGVCPSVSREALDAPHPHRGVVATAAVAGSRHGGTRSVLTSLHRRGRLAEQGGKAVIDGPLLRYFQSHHGCRSCHELCGPRRERDEREDAKRHGSHDRATDGRPTAPSVFWATR